MSNTLTAAELSWMRAEAENVVMPDTCHILSVTRTSDGQGGMNDTWGTAGTSIPCRLDAWSMTGREQMSGAAVQAYHGMVLHLPYDTTITTANRVKIGTTTFAVTSADMPKSWSITRAVEVERE